LFSGIFDKVTKNAKELGDSNKARYVQVRAEQIRHTFRQLPGIIMAMSLGTLLFVFVMWEQFPRSWLFAWAALMCSTVVVIPVTLLILYKRAKPKPAQLRLWGALFAVFGFVCASVWGSAGVIFFVSGSLEYQLLLLFCMLTAAAAGMATIIGYRPGFYAAVFPIVLPVALRSAYEGDSLHIGLSGIALLYLGLLSYFYNNVHASMVASLNLQFRNMELVREKSSFLAAASHDLRQPLHAQGLFVAELQERVHEPESRRILDHLEGSINAMQTLLNAMLDISKLDAGVVQPAVESFPVARVLDELEHEFTPQMREKKIRFRVIPASHIIQSDPGLLGRILRNFVSNALRYTPAGAVLVVCRRRADRLRIEVRDSGVGIPDDQQGAIFNEFYQLGNPERDQEKGLGLGLAIVERLARLMDHTISVVSQPGRGSTFSVDVPFGHAVSEPLHSDEPGVVMDFGFANASILVIEDDAMVQVAMRGLLADWGCDVRVVASADEALACLRRDALRPDVIIADYRLREGKTGTQAIESVKSELHCAIPALLITGDTSPERLREAQTSGYYFLHKPVHPLQLRIALAKAFHQSRKTPAIKIPAL
jgi:two-component system, sensor histidine kinase